MVKYRQKVKGGDAMEIEKSDLEWLLMFLVGLASLIIQLKAQVKQKPRLKRKKRKAKKRKR